MKTFISFFLSLLYTLHTLLRFIFLKHYTGYVHHCSTQKFSLVPHYLQDSPPPLHSIPLPLLKGIPNHKLTFVLIYFISNIDILYNCICPEVLKLALHYVISEYLKVSFFPSKYIMPLAFHFLSPFEA